MAKINELTTILLNSNTGVGGAFFSPKIIVGAFLCPKGFELDFTTDSVQAALIKASHATSKTARIYPIYDFRNPKDATESKTVQTFSDGSKTVVREGFADWSFQFVQGGLNLLQALRVYNGTNKDFLFVDADGRLIGIAGSSNTKIKAIPSDGGFFAAEPWKGNDGSKVAEFMIQFVFNVKHITDFLAYVEVGVGIDVTSTVKGLQDVALAVETGGTPGTYKLTAKTKVGINLADLYPAMAASTNFLVTNFTSGVAIPVTSVNLGKNTAGESCFVFVMNTSDANYPTGSNKISFDLNTPTVLQAAGYDGYESTGAASMVKN